MMAGWVMLFNDFRAFASEKTREPSFSRLREPLGNRGEKIRVNKRVVVVVLDFVFGGKSGSNNDKHKKLVVL